MFKLTTEKEEQSTVLKLEGRLGGPWVEVLDRYWRLNTNPERSRMVVDLTGVTFIDRAGKTLLARMHKEGATFHANGCLTKCIVEEITNTDRPWTAPSKSTTHKGE